MASLNAYTIEAKNQGGHAVDIDVKVSPRSDMNWMIERKGGRHHFEDKKSVNTFLERLGYTIED